MTRILRRLFHGGLAATLMLSGAAFAAVPHLIPFQFMLRDSAGAAVNTPVSVRFTLYDGAGDAAAGLWTESKAITPENGWASTMLGDATPFSVAAPPLLFNQPYWIGVKVGSDPEMTPRLPLAAAPYALSLPNVIVEPATGAVYIGQNAPQTQLWVNGNIRLGESGTLNAVASYEPLRIIRGMVSVSGGVQLGSGFTAGKLSTGRYEVAFNDNFSNNPSFIATASSYSTRIAKVELIGSNHAIVETFDAAGTLADSAFHFVAVGGR